MVPAAMGMPQYSGNFIPEIWSGLLQVKYYAASIFPGIANTKYEGEIKQQGDLVKIRTRPDIVISDYIKGMNLDIQHPDNPLIEFQIRKAKYFNFICDEIDRHQSDINLMHEWSQDAGQQMRVSIDALGLGDVYADANSDNSGTTAGADSGGYNLGASGSAVTITKANVLDYIFYMMACLDEQNVPEQGRWWALPNWMNLKLKLSDLKDVSMTGDSTSTLRHGRVGGLDGAVIHKSNQIKSVLSGGTKYYYPMAGHKDAITFASQMTKMETLKTERTFGSLVRGLNVFDYSVIKDEALVTGYVTKGTN